MKSILLLLFCFSAITSANECLLLDVYNRNLILDKSIETKKEYFKRVLPSMYRNESELKSEYLKKQGNSDVTSWLSDSTEFVNYTLYNRALMLTFLTQGYAYNERCIGDEGSLRIKLNVNIVSVDYNRFLLHFKKVNQKWSFYYIEGFNTNTHADSKFDEGIDYHLVK